MQHLKDREPDCKCKACLGQVTLPPLDNDYTKFACPYFTAKFPSKEVGVADYKEHLKFINNPEMSWDAIYKLSYRLEIIMNKTMQLFVLPCSFED